VITGFRLTYGSSQELFDVRPDMTVMGKIIGGGLPVAAYGGRRDIMEQISPLGPVYQAGTLSGNPLAMRAGLATLAKIDTPGFTFYPALIRKTRRLVEGLREALEKSGVPGQVNWSASLLTLFFTDSLVRNYADAKKSDTQRFAVFFREMLGQGILLPPSQFEAWFVSAAHTDGDIDRTIEAARVSLEALKAASRM
jgi:glutamate-1-semialdehyde 2,1-aminomutase